MGDRACSAVAAAAAAKAGCAKPERHRHAARDARPCGLRLGPFRRRRTASGLLAVLGPGTSPSPLLAATRPEAQRGSRGVLLGALRLGLFVLTCALSLTSCGRKSEAGRGPEPAALPREQTLYMAGLQWGPPSTFNPVAADPDWPVGEAYRELLYETLFAYDMISGELKPLLAKSCRWADDLTVEVSLDEEARWQNGEPFTADDVVYTYELARRYDLPYSAFWDYVADVKAVDAHTVHFKLDPKTRNRLMALEYICHTHMLPKSVFSAKETEFGGDATKLRQWTNPEPVGSGPYSLLEATPQRIVIKRLDDYWGKEARGLPAPLYVVHVIYKGNESGNLALEKGDVDVSQQFVPQVWKMWEGGKPVGTWLKEPPYFYVSGSMPSLIFNLHRKPMDDFAFRKAVAFALDYKQIAELAMTRYSPTMVPGLISKFGDEARYFDQKLVDELGWRYEPARAEQILRAAGYKKGADGKYRMPDGSPMHTLKVECPHGWTDWMSTLNIAAQNMREVGLNVEAEFPEYPPFYDRVQQGDFDMVMYNPSGSYSPAQPWLKFRNVMSAQDVPAVGAGRAFWNWGRYQSDEAEKLLAQIPTLSDEAERTKLYGDLNRLFMTDIPVLPIEYRPWLFYEFNTTWWQNFPTADNPYAPPQICTDGAGMLGLYKIRPSPRPAR